jgi:hypothetical protein
MINISSVRAKCESQPMETVHGIKMQQEFYQLCDLYPNVLDNDKLFCKLIKDTFQFFVDLNTNRPQMLATEYIKLLQCHFKLTKMTIGFAKMHIPKYIIFDNDKRVELPFEVITFSAYNRLRELGYNLTDYTHFSIINFFGLKTGFFFGVTEIHKTSIFKDPSQLHVIKNLR